MTNEELIILKAEIDKPLYANKSNIDIANMLDDVNQNPDNDLGDRLDYTPAQILECYLDPNGDFILEVFTMNDTQINYIDSMRRECLQFKHTPNSIKSMRILVSVIFGDIPTICNNILAMSYQKISKAKFLFPGTEVTYWDVEAAKLIGGN